ncbi:unnamed protein product, partial [marine sediment metagenome]
MNSLYLAAKGIYWANIEQGYTCIIVTHISA